MDLTELPKIKKAIKIIFAILFCLFIALAIYQGVVYRLEVSHNEPVYDGMSIQEWTAEIKDDEALLQQIDKDYEEVKIRLSNYGVEVEEN